MNGNKRQKRDTAENLYKNCKVTGNCPPDVVNKLEDKTWADVLLQAFSSIIFLGNLGIGTGKGSVSTTVRPIPGGRPIPETIAPTTVPSRPTISRPSVTRPTRPFAVPLDPISAGVRPVDPAGVKPVDVVNPSGPSIITLNEIPPDTIVTVGEGQIPEINIITDTTSINSHPTVFQSPENGVAILNVTPADPPPTRVLFTQETSNPLFETTTGHIDPAIDVIVNPFATVETITFGEEIPLDPIAPVAEFDIEDVPTTSTPLARLEQYINRAREFYRRYIPQVPTRNIDFLGDVSRAIEFGFENPAFDPEVSIQFAQDVDEVTAAPDPDFAGIRRISRPFLTATSRGNIRVSRLGTRGGVTTRSGVTVGQDIHYYYDISTIDNIELATLSSRSTAIVEPSTQETILDSSTGFSNIFQDTELLDAFTENFNNAHLVVQGLEDSEDTVSFPIYNSLTFRPSVFDIGNGLFVSAETNSKGNTVYPYIPSIPLVPEISVNIYADDYILHPSLLKKRKRKRSDSF